MKIHYFISSWKKFFLSGLLFFSLFPIFAEVSYGKLTFNKDDVNEFDRPLMTSYSKPLDVTATVLEYSSLLSPLFLIPSPKEDYWKIAVEYAETAAFTYLFTEVIKHSVTRYRPYMYFEGAPQSEIDSGDYANSFFSGHSAISFAAAGFTTFQALTYFPDSPYKWITIGSSYLLCTTTAILRLASGNHFVTDVLTGALVGSAFGFFIPWVNQFWFKPTVSENVSTVVSPMGFAFSVKL